MTKLYQKHFVLKPRGMCRYAEASRVAVLAYAEDIQDIDPELASDIRAWVAEESRKAHKAGE